MRNRVNRIPPALKHGAYSAIAVLPGESTAAFEKLHRDLIAELNPSGALEKDIVADLARYVWRKQNLVTLRISEFAQKRGSEAPAIGERVVKVKKILQQPSEENVEIMGELNRMLEQFGDAFELVEIGEAATCDGLIKELDIKERLDASIDKCLKRLLFLRGLKSISGEPPSEICEACSRAPEGCMTVTFKDFRHLKFLAGWQR